MKKRISLLLTLLVCAAFLFACTNTSDQGEETDSATGVESVDSGMEGETELGTETDPFETQLYENSGLSASEPVTGSAALFKPYAERITSSDGSVSLAEAGVTMNFTSLFFGHDSAIDRDLVQYGWRFSSSRMKGSLYQGEFIMADLTGDHYSDMVTYADGILSVYPAVVDTKKTFEYNGKTYNSVYGDDKSMYSFGDPATYTLGLTHATLRGSGDFDGNGFVDLLFVQADGTVVLGLVSEDGIIPTSAGRYRGEMAKLYGGDVDGDGLCDLVVIEDHTVTSLLNTGDGFALSEMVTLPFANPYTAIQVADINNDRRADVIWYEEGADASCFRTMFGRGDGFFGPHPEEFGENGKGNTNLYAVSETEKIFANLDYFAVGDMTGDGVGDVIFHTERGLFGVGYNNYDPAYDYSLFGFVTEEGTYRIFSGGRWYDQSEAVEDSTNGQGTGDGDHVMLYFSKDGITWDRYIDGPAFYLGWEQGLEGDLTANELWWTGNTLEPEVIYVDGVYHMLIQTSGVTESGYYGDYIGYASSTDGIHFTRKIDSPVILPEPGKTFAQFKEVYGDEYGFNHHELIYVPDDPDGKCFHLYTGNFKNDAWAGYYRIRSADPTCFYWSDREWVDGFAQIGNQVGYISNYDGNGGRLFLRITFHSYTDEDGTRDVPTLFYSTDGLNFYGTGINLAAVDVTDPVTENNHNVYFLGFCTLNGTGEIQRNEDGSYKLVYLATTANASGGMPIFAAEAGVGVLNFTLD